jgi:hypothetical protein
MPHGVVGCGIRYRNFLKIESRPDNRYDSDKAASARICAGIAIALDVYVLPKTSKVRPLTYAIFTANGAIQPFFNLDKQRLPLAAETEVLAAEQDRLDTEAAVKAAEVEALELRQALEQARAEAEALRQAEATRSTEVAKEADRPTMVASRIDEVQLRRLQEAEQGRKALGRLARLRAAWRG